MACTTQLSSSADTKLRVTASLESSAKDNHRPQTSQTQSDTELFATTGSDTTPPLIWLIGGSDSGGSSGIQADLRTVNALGAHGCTVLTAVTAQNSRQLDAVFALTPHQLLTQLNTLYADLKPVTIKIGQLPDASIARALTNWLAAHRQDGQPVVIWDPVFYASSGALLSDLGIDCIDELLQVVDILTPNLAELALLSQADSVAKDVTDQEAHRQLLTLQAYFGGDILLKGGHGTDPGICTDLWLAAADNKKMAANARAVTVAQTAPTNPASAMQQSSDTFLPQQAMLQQASLISTTRLPNAHSRGTGCTLASALASAIALGYAKTDAIAIARAYLTQALRRSYPTGAGSGSLGVGHWPQQQTDFPHWQEIAAPLPATLNFAQMQQQIGLYPVVDDVQWLVRLLPLGVRTIQLRLKNKHPAELERQIKTATELCRRENIQLFINDHWQLALKYQAFGVHLGQQDLASADLAAIATSGLRLGVSTHGYAELARVLPLKPSYIALGHIFPTQTKQMPSTPQGLARLAQYVQLCAARPTVAIGGINARNIEQVLQTGVTGVAVVSAIISAAQPEQALRQLQQYCHGFYAASGSIG